MREITIEELEKTDPAERTIIDIRTAERYKSNTIPGAINWDNFRMDREGDIAESTVEGISANIAEDATEGVSKAGTGMNRLERLCASVPKDKPVYILCNTGEHSADVAEYMEEHGWDAYNIRGGFRSWLKAQLAREIGNENYAQRTQQAERSIIKKFRKQLWSRFTKACRDYDLIQKGDKIAVCISGGKDSMLMAKLMQEIQKHGNIPFELVFLCMNPGYNEDNWAIVQNNAKILEIPLTVFNSQIFDTVVHIDKSPCYLCARMRRGYLYSRAQALGCNKIALGHHYDDVIETILMGMLYAGKVETMMPKARSQHFEGMELIRPMYLIREADIKAWRDYNGLSFIQCACRFTENCASCGGDHPSKRDEMKALIAGLCEENPVIAQNIFNSVTDINLHNVIGYHSGDEHTSFLDTY